MMEANKYFVCCEQCFESICRESTRAAKLWMDYCAHQLSVGQIVELEDRDSPEIQKLETMGFIVSTETDTRLLVRVNGHISTLDGEHYFCVKAGHCE